MADYSHLKNLRPTLEGLARYERIFGPLNDAYLLEALDLIDPPLLPPDALESLRRELDHDVPRPRGAPASGTVPPLKLLELLHAAPRPDVPWEIMQALRTRVALWRRVTAEDFAVRQNRYWQTEKRDSLICGIYAQLYRQIDNEPPLIIGADVPVDPGPLDRTMSRHERAIAATAHVMRTRLLIETPGPRRMANIISQREIAHRLGRKSRKSRA